MNLNHIQAGLARRIYQNDVGSILKLVAYTNDANFKDEWQLITDRTYLGALTTTWHSDASSVGYWDLDGTSKSINVYVEKLNISETSMYMSKNLTYQKHYSIFLVAQMKL